MSSIRLTRLPFLVLAGFVFSLSAAAQAPAPEPQMGEGDIGDIGDVGDTVNVEIKIVPFYAVDEQGKPVLDLKQDEIELRVDGKPMLVDTFDAFPQVGGATTIANAGSPEAPAEAPAPAPAKAQKPARRHVVLFFDVAFSSLRGFESGRKFAEKMVKEAPESDLLYLVTYDFKTGLKQRLGPLGANEKGKKELLASLRKLKPEAGMLDQQANYGNIPLITRGETKNGIPAAQNSALYMAVRNNSDAQLENNAVRLAESFQVLAEQFQRINEPKLMVFLSQGIDNRLYWEGSDIALQFSTAPFAHINNKQFRGLHTLYEKPLQQLAETGTLSLFVNLDDKSRGAGGGIGSSMQHMARMSGGLYLGDVDPAVTNQRAASSTGAYYEAGFYLGDAGIRPSRAKVEVLVKRPGVRTWSAGTIKTRETWRGLSEDARRLLIVDLVEGDAEAQRARSSVRLDLKNLPGNVLGRSTGGKTLLRYEVGWPQELAGRRIDLYNVVIEPTRQAGSPNILRFDKQGTSVDGTVRNIDVEVPEKATFVWGIVAVEPATGKTWYRRFHLQGRQAQK
jgi:VWFA-related protein